MRAPHALLVAVLVVPACFAQECGSGVTPLSQGPIEYVQAELRALQWIRSALIEASKIPPPAPPDDPKRSEKAAKRNAAALGLEKYYECASQQIAPFQENRNKYVQASAQAFLNGIKTSSEVNRRVLEELRVIDSVTSTEQVDPDTRKRLVDLTRVEESARSMITGAVKMSTFALVQLKHDDTQAEPVAFTITSRQRDALLQEITEFRKQGIEPATFLESCTTILRGTLTQQLPFPPLNPASSN